MKRPASFPLHLALCLLLGLGLVSCSQKENERGEGAPAADGAAARQGPEEVVRAYLEALWSSDTEAAFARLHPSLRRRPPRRGARP